MSADHPLQTSARRLEALLKPLSKALAVLAAFAATALAALLIASVTMRYVTNAPFRFTEELAGLLMTSVFFLALPYVTLRAEHVRVQLFSGQFAFGLARRGGVAQEP